jgi:sodium/potassium/calcium exchanger 6
MPYQLILQLSFGIAGLSMAILVAIFSEDGKNPATRLARCIIGFLVAVVWIMAIADEVVNVLQVS